MGINEINKLSAQYLTTLKDTDNEVYSAEIKVLNYYELGCIVVNVLKLCVLALDQEANKVSETQNDQSINVGLMLEVALQLFPLDELEFLDKMNEIVLKSGEVTE